MGSDRFEFKHFGISHHNSSMKVGIDSILLGSWTNLDGVKRILDVGTGCGILALMCAQRNQNSLIDAIDIDYPSVKEADENFKSSLWSERLSCRQADFLLYYETGFDLIISNPPYFNSGINEIVNSRERARHQNTLSPKILLEKGKMLLSERGKISMIIPVQQKNELICFAFKHGMCLKREAAIKGRKDLNCKRVMLEFAKLDYYPEGVEKMEIILEESPGVYTDQFKLMCKDFYLHF